MSVLDLVIKDDNEKRNDYLISYLIEHDTLYYERNNNTKSLFKYMASNYQSPEIFLVEIIKCKYKSIFSINTKWIKEGRTLMRENKLIKNMIFIFDCDDSY